MPETFIQAAEVYEQMSELAEAAAFWAILMALLILLNEIDDIVYLLEDAAYEAQVFIAALFDNDEDEF